MSGATDRILRSRCKRHGACLCTDELTSEPHQRRRESAGTRGLSRAMPLALIATVSSAARRFLSTEASQQAMTTATMSYSEAGSVSGKMLAQAAPPLRASGVARNPALGQLEVNRKNHQKPGYFDCHYRLSLTAVFVVAVIAAAIIYRHNAMDLTEAAVQGAATHLAALYAMSTATLWSLHSGMTGYLSLIHASQPASPEADQLPDYALLSGGARVESTRDSQAYGSVSLWRQVLWFWWQRPGPEVALTAVVQPGACWAFVGFPGRLAVRLSHPIRVSAVSIDHVPRWQSYNDSVASAPRAFSVYGLTEACLGLDAAEKLGSFTYDAEAGPPTQTFRLARGATAERYPIVELVVHSNHGSADYTCLYRFRVHGHM